MKPLIRECIHEVLVDEGILAKVVSEVAKGIGNVIVESPKTEPPPEPQANHNQEAIEQQKRRLDEQRKRLSSAIGNKAYKNIFEGVTPMGAPSSEPSTQASALSGVAPSDPGVDISGIMALGGRHWKKIAKG